MNGVYKCFTSETRGLGVECTIVWQKLSVKWWRAMDGIPAECAFQCEGHRILDEHTRLTPVFLLTH